MDTSALIRNSSYACTRPLMEVDPRKCHHARPLIAAAPRNASGSWSREKNFRNGSYSYDGCMLNLASRHRRKTSLGTAQLANCSTRAETLGKATHRTDCHTLQRYFSHAPVVWSPTTSCAATTKTYGGTSSQ